MSSEPIDPRGHSTLIAFPDIRAGDPERPTRVRSRHVAELVADELRRRILDGELDDGDELPRQDDLVEEFGISRPSLREALRILETEGIVSVRRGKVGGAIVHRPDRNNAAYALGLVLRTQSVAVHDVFGALNILEGQCAALAAGRADRTEAVVDPLLALNREAETHIVDIRRFTQLSRRFHESLVATCGNATLALAAGALEKVWTAHALAWTEQQIRSGAFPDEDYRRQGVADHYLLLEFIESGDAEGAAAEAARHQAWSPVYSVDDDHAVDPTLL